MSYAADGSEPIFGRPAPLFDPETHPALFDAVLSKRVLAFFVDALIVLLLMIVPAVVVFILGVLSFGLGWVLFGPMFVIIALGYVALTLGGPKSATLGMRLAGIEMRTLAGQLMFPTLAAAHALLFWFTMSFLTPLSLVVGLFNRRRRLIHDFLIGVVMVDSYAMSRLQA